VRQVLCAWGGAGEGVIDLLADRCVHSFWLCVLHPQLWHQPSSLNPMPASAAVHRCWLCCSAVRSRPFCAQHRHRVDA
jgi:hypothetical protein